MTIMIIIIIKIILQQFKKKIIIIMIIIRFWCEYAKSFREVRLDNIIYNNIKYNI